jgi:anaerobic magnesium-protoporphyrin IX monomethyl ester cyclase
MKVMLIYPLPVMSRKAEPNWLPLGLSFIASTLRQGGHEVIIFDRYASAARFGPDKAKIDGHMLQTLLSFKPDLVGFNAVTPLIYDTAACAGLIRQEFSGPLIAGGHHPTAMPELTLQKIPQLNGVVQGEGEIVMPGLASGKDPLSLPGVWWKNGNVIKGSAPEQIADLDILPFPALDLLDMEFYTHPGKKAIKAQYLSSVSLITSRGCTRRCAFCTEHLTYGKKVRMHSPGYILEWMHKILADYRINAFYFHDNDFLADKERAALVCEKIVEAGLHRKVKFAIQARADHLDPKILDLLKRAGCTLIEIGLETDSQDQLNSINKGTSVDMNRLAIEMCREAGIAVHAYMMQGFEGETINDLEQRLSWIKAAGGTFTVSLSNLQIYPGTALYREKGNSFFEDNPWTREEINNYYRTDHLSAVSSGERLAWTKEKLTPELRRRNRLAILSGNSMRTIVRIIFDKVKKKISA